VFAVAFAGGQQIVNAQPVIVAQPRDQTAVQGTTATFAVEAAGTPPLSYQWRTYPNPTTFTDIPGGTNATLLWTNAQPTNLRFGVVVANGEGAVTSALARLTVLLPVTILSNPLPDTVIEGTTVTFSLSATGSPPLFYQWRRNETDLTGRTNASLVLSNVVSAQAGDYSVVVRNVGGSLTSAIAPLKILDGVGATFSRITNSPVTTDGADGNGAAWGDFNNDGYLDLFVASGSGNNLLYRNNADGTFSKVTTGPVVSLGGSRGCTWGDYDNDGHLDLYVSSPSTDYLFRNNGDGTFARIVNNAPSTEASYGNGSTWGDYDNDGFLDLFIATGVGEPDVLYHNERDGSFTRLLSGGIGTDLSTTIGAAWGDYDNDGWPDLISPSSPGHELLYHNNGGLSFTHVQVSPGTVLAAASYGIAWGDYDNDGDLDLILGNAGNSYLYRNDHEAGFTRITNGRVANSSATGVGCAWGDYDNDGYLDLFVATGLSSIQNDMLFRNAGDGTFARVLTGPVVTDVAPSVGCGWADYDNDGFLDLFVSSGYGVVANDFLYHNDGNSNHWLKVKCVGTLANRSAIGAKVRVLSVLGGEPIWQLREIASADGLRANPLEAHFGLRDATNVITLRIEWPSRQVTELQNLSANQFLTITEPPRIEAVATTIGGAFHLRLTGRAGERYAIETSDDLETWAPWQTVTNTAASIDLFDSTASQTVRRFYRAAAP
jgi:hypothetical protein